jgi:Mce-associated membrane protein
MTDDKPDADAAADLDEADAPAHSSEVETNRDAEPRSRRHLDWSRAAAFGLLPVLALLLALGAGFLRWEYSSKRDAQVAADESVTVARDATVAILSYSADNAEKELLGARERLTGSFLDAYTDLVKNVVIPGAREKKISAKAQVPAAASVSASPDRAVVLVFVDQTVTVGNDAPSNTASSVRVTLDKVNGRWLVSGFDPV